MQPTATDPPPELRSADDVRARCRALYGEELGALRGVLHVVAVAEDGAPGDPRVIRIGEAAPKSAWDALALGLARARAEAIVITGQILRDEPSLCYGPLEPALASFRRELGIASEPWLLVLTRGRGLPAEHPVWSSAARPLVLTARDAAAPLRAALPPHVEIVGVGAPSAEEAIEHLGRERGARGISLEAGPRTVAPLYAERPRIDELALSVFEGPLDPRARGGPLVDPAWLARAFARPAEPCAVREASGRWRFERWLRRPAPAA